MSSHPRAAWIGRLVPLGLGFALVAYVARRLGWNEILGMLSDMRWCAVPVLAMYAGHQMARAAALVWCVFPRGELGFADALWIRLSGEAIEFLTFTGPIGSEPTKAWLLHRRGLDLAGGLGATLTEYLASMVAAAVAAVIGVGYVLFVLQPVGPVRAAAIGVLVSMSTFVAIVVAAMARRVGLLGAIVKTVTGRRMPSLDAVEDVLMRTARETPRRLAAILSFEFAAQAFLGLELWFLLAGLRLPCSIGCATLMEGVMKFLNAGFFVPGQIGVAEGSYAVVFSTFGLPAAAGVTISVARRLRNAVTALAGTMALMCLRWTSVVSGRTPPSRLLAR
jgi:hypothetical protein